MRQGIDLSGPLPAALALAACGIWAATLPPVPDHAWQFYMAEQVLDGARLYIDVGAADMHPPLFTWLAMAVAALGRLFGTDGLALYPVLVLGVVAVTATTWWRTVPASGWMLAVLIVALLPMAGPYLGQGEHLALLLSLPYMIGAAATIAGRPPARGIALATGVAAGVGLAMKPHFALVWLAVEMYLALRRGARSLLRTESVAVGSVFVLYVLAALMLTPTLFELLPWLVELYPRFAPKPFSMVLFDARALLLIVGIAAGFTVRSDDAWTPLARVLTVAALAMYAALLLQGKGWGYHWYPVTALSLLLCGLALRPFLGRVRVLVPALAMVAVVWMQHQADRTTLLLIRDPVMLPDLMDVVEQHAAGEAIVAFSPLLHTGFPLVNLTGTRWASPYAHLWMVQALYTDGMGNRLPVEYRKTGGKWQIYEQQMFDRLWTSIEREDPALLLLYSPSASMIDYRAYFETDARYRALFARTAVIDTIGRYIILRRTAPTGSTAHSQM